MKKIFSALALLLLASGAQAALETSASQLTNKNQVDLFTFSVDALGSLVNIYTESSTPANLALTLWSTTAAAPTAADWTLVASNDNRTTADFFETMNSLDAKILPNLSAGQYLVSIYGSGIAPIGNLLADGFTGAGAAGLFQYSLNVDGASVMANSLNFQSSVSAVPLPAAVWMFGSGLMGFLGLSKRKEQRQTI